MSQDSDESKTESQTETQAKVQPPAEWESEFKKVIAQRDEAKREKREAQAKADELASALQEVTRGKARSSKDIDTLESSYKEVISAKDKALQDKDAKLKDLMIKYQVKSEAEKLLSSSGAEAFLLVNHDRLEITDTDDGPAIKIKNSVKSVSDELAEFAEKFPGFKPSNIKQGSGSNGNTAKNGEASLASLKGLTPAEVQQVLSGLGKAELLKMLEKR